MIEKQINNKVSIILANYNTERYIENAIKSVIEQTYQNIELLIVDDCSKDSSIDVIQKYMQKDKRIKLIKLNKNKGCANARNIAIRNSQGRYIAFIDSDDIYIKDKIEKQVLFMKDKNIGFCCTDYYKIDQYNNDLRKKIKMPKKCSYYKYLSNTIIQLSGVMIDTKIIPKKYIIMPRVRLRSDGICFAKILKKGYICYGLSNPLFYYRDHSKSISSNKLKCLYINWKWYSKIEKIPFVFRIFLFLGYVLNGIRKRIYIFKILNKIFGIRLDKIKV